MSTAHSRSSRKVPRRLLVRFLVLPALLAGAFAVVHWTPLGGYLSGPALNAPIDRLRQPWWAPALLVGSYLLLSPLGVPATPLMIVGGVVFGGAAASLYNFARHVVGGPPGDLLSTGL